MKIDTDPLISKASRSLRLAIALVIALTLFYTIWFWGINKQPLSQEAGLWGAFGDFIGCVMNPIVALLALYWLTQSIAIQKQELHDTRLVLEAQAKGNELKRFEDTFFALLAEHNSLLSQLKNVPEDRLSVIDVHARIFQRTNQIDEAKDSLEERDSIVGHYFRLLYQVMKFIAIKCPGTTCSLKQLEEASPQSLPSDEEKFYSNILRSALDTKTSQLLAINSYCTDPRNSFFKYRRLVERYAFLEHMPFRAFEQDPSPVLLSIYETLENSAFGRSDYVQELRLLGYVP